MSRAARESILGRMHTTRPALTLANRKEEAMITAEATPIRAAATRRALRAVPAPMSVGDSLVVRLSTSPEHALRSVQSLDPTGRLTRALDALGIGDHLALPPAALRRTDPDGARFGLVWRLDGGQTPRDAAGRLASGHVAVEWELEVGAAEGGDALLSVSTRITAADEPTRVRLLDAWSVVNGLATAVARNVAKAVEASADADFEDRLAA
jgi:hypothetical protein